jgi:hypothetical protein
MTDSEATDLFLKRMFDARRAVLRSGAVVAGLTILLVLNEYAALLTDLGVMVAGFAILAVLPFILVGTLVVCYHMFRVGYRERGLGYAIGHVATCIGLAWMGLIGIMVVPLLISYDVERWRQWEATVSHGGETVDGGGLSQMGHS